MLSVKNLKTHLFTEQGAIRAVDDVSFEIGKKEILGLAGESGCGKTMTALSIMQLLPTPPARITGGEIIFEGTNLLDKTPDEMRSVRGRDISMIFQEPMTSLNPVFTVGYQISEALRVHTNAGKQEAKERAINMLSKVGIPDPSERYNSYPYELSGGMQQRVMIAMALVCNAKLLIADEPTTSLDVTVQKQILQLLLEIREKFSISVLFITHDLSILRMIADRIAIMFGGKLVENRKTEGIFRSPEHPYTKKLFSILSELY